jgi:hypothetical protein
MLIEYTHNSALVQAPTKFKFPTLKFAKLAKGLATKISKARADLSRLTYNFPFAIIGPSKITQFGVFDFHNWHII